MLLSGRRLEAALTSVTLERTALSAQAGGFVTAPTAGVGGVSYPLGVALSKIYGEHVERIRISVQPQRWLENLNLIQTRRGRMAFTLR